MYRLIAIAVCGCMCQSCTGLFECKVGGGIRTEAKANNELAFSGFTDGRKAALHSPYYQ